MSPMLGRLFLLTVLCRLGIVAGEADVDKCAESSASPGAGSHGSGLLQSKTHLDPSRLKDFEGEEWRGSAGLMQQELANESSNKLAAQCRRAKPTQPMAVAEQQRKEVRSTTRAQSEMREECPGQIRLLQFGRTHTETTCCPTDSMECGGCAVYKDGKCETCRGGFIRQNASCVACLSALDWVNENGVSCDAIAGAGCNDRPVKGISSNQACCNCGGGHKSPTPFQYEEKRFAVGSPIELKPIPRTARRYSVDAGCSLAVLNLTIDGSTGVISYDASKQRPAKAFSVQCEVTAHQGLGLSETVKVTVAADFMTYSSNTLVFSKNVSSYPVSTARGTWRDFSMTCAPEAPWLSLDSSTGLLQTSADTAGAVTEAGDGNFMGIDGAVCVVSAWQFADSPNPNNESKGEQRSSTMVVLQPRPWPALDYGSSFAEVVVGEELPPLKLKVPAGYEEGAGGLKPTSFDVFCLGDEHGEWNGNRSIPSYEFQGIWGVGLVGTNQVLEVAADGSIIIAPRASMAKLFDEMLADSFQLKSVILHCEVWGSFPGTQFQPLHTSLDITIKDSMCWVSETFRGEVVGAETHEMASGCRNSCRFSKVCSHFTYNQSENSCKFYRINNEMGSPVTAYAKVTDCTDLSSCIRLQHPEWAIAGDFCPVEYDYRRGGPVYRKESSIPQEVMYLAKVPPGTTSDCPVGNWLVQEASPIVDFVDAKMGYFELGGDEKLCLDAGLPSEAGKGSIHLDWATMPCGRPLFDEVEDEKIHPLVFDDPTTAQPDDFWLHPCDCVPHEWGSGWPVNPLVVEGMPAGSDGTYIPPPTLIVSGQFACPSRQLLPGKMGIHFVSEAESFESADCQERCKDFANCNFYWTGTSHGAETCRLFSGCDALVREFGMEGDLMALPHNESCMVANPEVCWKTTLRRQFLTQKISVSPSYAKASIVINPGGIVDFTSNMSRTLDRQSVYSEKIGNYSTVKMLGFTEIPQPYGYVRGVGGLASATVDGLNPGQAYHWELYARSNQPDVSHKVAVNHGDQISFAQRKNSGVGMMTEGSATSNPRGELVFDFEATESGLFPTDQKSGVADKDKIDSCPAGFVMTSCNCYADRGICAGAQAHSDGRCQAYGTKDVNGYSWEPSKVRVHMRCLDMTYIAGYEVKTSSGASFSFLQQGGETDAEEMETGSKWGSRRRRRRRSRRRRRVLPAQVSASCASGKQLLSCTCYPDAELDQIGPKFKDVRHNCKEVWRSGNTCYAKGGYAQAICATLLPPAAVGWQDVSNNGRYWSDTDEGPAAVCPSSTVLVGCRCSSSDKDCNRVWTEGNACKATVGAANGRITRVHSSIEVIARCADVRSSVFILSSINLTRVSPALLLQGDSDAVTSDPFSPLTFRYMHLYQQCDSLLLMGGVGVEHCNRPSLRDPTSHIWRGKRPLPISFLHGSQLAAGCWRERYQAFRTGSLQPTETMHCVNGDWLNTLQLPEMTGFSCEPCVLVGGPGYNRYVKKQQQELYYFSRMGMRVFTELGSVAASSGAAQQYCLQKDASTAKAGANTSVGGKMTLRASHACPEILTMEVVGSGEVGERVMQLLEDGAPDHNQCLQAAPAEDGVNPSLVYKTCDLEEEQQLISPMAVPSILWNMHQEADRTRGQDFHQDYGSFCGAHGALSSLAFGQIFGGDITGLKSTCLFAPVIQFGEFQDSTITYDKRQSNWPNWNTILADSPILCPDGEALTGFKLLPARNVFRYECSRIGGLGASYEYFSAQVEVKKFDALRANWIDTLRMIKVDCGLNGLLSGFHFEFSEGGRWARSKFICSKAGGAPVVMEPSTAVESLSQTPEGIFCPLRPDLKTGRFMYANAQTGDTLTYLLDGSWCVGPDCSAPVGGATPVGVVMSIFEVTNVSDFDGHFEAKGVPSLEEGGMAALMRKVKAIKPKKRPTQPQKPKLQDFKSEMPKYSSECLDYQDLWTKLVETSKTPEGEEIVEESKLAADEGTVDAELPEYHPCDVARNQGGIFGRLAGQSGATAPENMLYDSWNECMQGDIKRDFLSAKLDFGNSLYHTIANVIQGGIKLVCAIPPNVEIAPLGAGVEASPPSICDQVVDFVRTIIDIPFDIGKSAMDYALEDEGFRACNPFEVGFPRLFCDIHCVRDAVIRGDRTILRNLEKATKISNHNMQKMVEWSTEAARTESEYLDKKIDHSLKINTIYLEHIAKNTQPPEEDLIQNAARATRTMLGELRGLADTSSFGISRIATGDALDRFVAGAEPLTADNLTQRHGQVEKFQRQLSSLYQSMQTSAGGMTKAQVVGRQVAMEARQLQAHLRRQEQETHKCQLLGIYRAHSHASHKASKSWKSWKQSAAEEMLVRLDTLWWRVREKLDRYLDVAGDEIDKLQQSFIALSEYENCKAGTMDLLKSYRSGARTMHKSHRHLRAVWRETSNLMGELASTISDGDVFGRFMTAEGCNSPLATQTLDQTRLALQGTGFLLHRFQVAGLPQPDAAVLQDAVKRIHQAHASASSECTEHQTEATLEVGPISFLLRYIWPTS